MNASEALNCSACLRIDMACTLTAKVSATTHVLCRPGLARPVKGKKTVPNQCPS
jgi:hypothetical protein